MTLNGTISDVCVVLENFHYIYYIFSWLSQESETFNFVSMNDRRPFLTETATNRRIPLVVISAGIEHIGIYMGMNIKSMWQCACACTSKAVDVV